MTAPDGRRRNGASQ